MGKAAEALVTVAEPARSSNEAPTNVVRTPLRQRPQSSPRGPFFHPLSVPVTSFNAGSSARIRTTCASQISYSANYPRSSTPPRQTLHPGTNNSDAVIAGLRTGRSAETLPKLHGNWGEVMLHHDRKASSAWATRIPALRTRNAATASNMGGSNAINMGALTQWP